MLNTGGENLDARLLRFRADPASENAGRLADQLLGQSRTADALEVLSTRLAQVPDDVDALIGTGRAYLAAGELLRAQQALMEAAKLAPADSRPFRFLGEVLLKRGDPSRASKVLSKAKEGGSVDPEVDRLLARATRLARLADGEPPEAPGFREEPPTAKVAYVPSPEVTAPKVALAQPPAVAAVASPPMPAAPRAPAAIPPAPRRRPLATQMGIGQLGAVAPAAKPAPPPEEPTVVAEDMRARLERELARLDGLDASAPAPAPEPQALFDEEPTRLHERVPEPEIAPPVVAPEAAPAVASAPRAIAPAPRPIPPRPSPSSPPPVRASAAESEIPENLPPRSAPAPRAVRPAPSAKPTSSARPGAAEDVDAILSMLEEERIFEPPAEEPTAWAEKAQIERGGTRVGRMFVGLWVLALLGAGGAYYGFQKHTEQQKAEAGRMRDEATTLALRGDEVDLDRALELLDRADERDPTAVAASQLRLVILSEQSLESGGVDRTLVRAAIDRAERARADAALVRIGRAVVAYSEGRADRVVELLGGEAEASDDPWVTYLRGRLLQRLGRDGATDALAASVAAEPRLVAAELALVEADSADQRLAEARERIDRVLARDPDHLRAQLLQVFLEADAEAPDVVLTRVSALESRLDEAGPMDRALARLLEARGARRKGETRRAADAVQRAAAESIPSPRILVLLAREAAAVGELGRAQQAATVALAAAPGDVRARALLAELQLDRGDAEEALRTLSSLSTDDPEVLRLSARAALLLGGAALEAADAAMDAHLAGRAAAPVEMQALSLRMKARRTGATAELLAAAEQLTRSAPGDVHALTALANLALDARDASKALAALERLVETAGDRASTHFLLGRARRMAGDAAGARAAFGRALEIEPGHGDAKIALGYLLLDMGEYEAAEALYQEMARGSIASGGPTTTLLARLGRVEALVGLGRLADAKVQLEGVPERDRERPEVRITTARIALAEDRPADALGALRPVAEAEGASADLVALYGDALYAAGETELASAQYTRALQSDAGSPEGLVGYAQVLVRGEKYRDAGNILDRAGQALERRIRPPALRARMLVLRGRVHLAENARAEASAALRQATALPGARPEAWFYLGEALSGTNAPEARAAYARYLELAPDGPLAERAQRAMR